MTRRLILLVDDDRIPTQYYCKALEQTGFNVKHFTNPDDTFAYVENENPALALIILDLMMLPGKRYENFDTQDGIRTGVYIYRDLRKMYPTTPILILTNVENKEILEDLYNAPDVEIVHKLDYTPFQLADLVKGKTDFALDLSG